MDGYLEWGLRILHVLIMSDGGQRYGKSLALYDFHNEMRTLQLHPFEEYTAYRLSMNTFMYIPGVTLTTPSCPGCSSSQCLIFLTARTRLLDYNYEQSDVNVERISLNGGNLGPTLRYQGYRQLSRTSLIAKPWCFNTRTESPEGGISTFVKMGSNWRRSTSRKEPSTS